MTVSVVDRPTPGATPDAEGERDGVHDAGAYPSTSPILYKPVLARPDDAPGLPSPGQAACPACRGTPWTRARVTRQAEWPREGQKGEPAPWPLGKGSLVEVLAADGCRCISLVKHRRLLRQATDTTTQVRTPELSKDLEARSPVLRLL